MKEMYLSIYDNRTISEEPVVFIKENGVVKATLSERPIAVLKVYNPITDETLSEEDFVVDNNTLLLKSNKARFMEKEWLYVKNLPSHIKHTGAEYKIFDVLLMDVPQLASLQYRVTYTAEEPNFPQTAYYPTALSALRDKAKRGEEVKIILYGDSISNAANSSGEGAFPPFEKAWYEQAVLNARAYYSNEKITLVNRSRSGYGTEWGAECANEKIEECDLLIVAFGMNDATADLSCEEYMANVRTILQERKNTDCAVLLISSILPNPDSELYHLLLRKEYGSELKALCERENYAFMDMLSISEYYLQTKAYCEISGNNFNHPNDFIYRFYADALTYLLTTDKETRI